jgi:hypothetical protein
MMTAVIRCTVDTVLVKYMYSVHFKHPTLQEGYEQQYEQGEVAA